MSGGSGGGVGGVVVVGVLKFVPTLGWFQNPLGFLFVRLLRTSPLCDADINIPIPCTDLLDQYFLSLATIPDQGPVTSECLNSFRVSFWVELYWDQDGSRVEFPFGADVGSADGRAGELESVLVFYSLECEF